MKLTTVCDNQVEVLVSVYEGEKFIAKENNFLGKFYLRNIPPLPKGVPMFDVCFDIDVDGILTVSATLVGTNNTNQITLTNHSGRLTKDEINRMVREGEMYKKQSEEFDEIERSCKARDELLNYIEEVKDMVRPNGYKISEDDMVLVSEAIDHTSKWCDWNYIGGTAYMFKKKKDELQKVCDYIRLG